MPIHAAVRHGNLAAVTTLIHLGEDKDVIGGHDDDTPLLLAVYYNHHDIAEYLVQMEADVLIENSDNMTAMDYAADEEMEQILTGTFTATDSPECHII